MFKIRRGVAMMSLVDSDLNRTTLIFFRIKLAHFWETNSGVLRFGTDEKRNDSVPALHGSM